MNLLSTYYFHWHYDWSGVRFTKDRGKSTGIYCFLGRDIDTCIVEIQNNKCYQRGNVLIMEP